MVSKSEDGVIVKKKRSKKVIKKLTIKHLLKIAPKIEQALFATTSVAKLKKARGFDLKKVADLIDKAGLRIKKEGGEYLWE